uniref:C2H2-type domain-containing protein n=1 Tax=Parascaris equorum TaxID=6256 RepID=A0A914RIK5_PAREQ
MCSINVAFAGSKSTSEKEYFTFGKKKLCFSCKFYKDDILNNHTEGSHYYLKRAVSMARSGDPNAPLWSTSGELSINAT